MIKKTEKKRGDVVKMYVQKNGKGKYIPVPVVVMSRSKKDNVYSALPYSPDVCDELGFYNNIANFDMDEIDMAKKITEREARIICDTILGVDELPE